MMFHVLSREGLGTNLLPSRQLHVDELYRVEVQNRATHFSVQVPNRWPGKNKGYMTELTFIIAAKSSS
jgi:hypothetical protein